MGNKGGINTQALMGSLRAIQMGYAGKNEPDPDHVVFPPWTRRDVGDMYYIKDKTTWLLSEIKTGHLPTQQIHIQTIRNIISLHRALEEKERACRAKFNPYHKPAGTPEGGQFDFAPGNGGSGGSTAPSTPSGNVMKPPPGKKPGRTPSNEGSSSTIYNPDTASRHARRNIYDPKKYPHGRGRCAAKVREAVEAGLGHSIPPQDMPPLRKGPNPRTGQYEETRWARDYGPTFEKVGFEKITTSEPGERFPPPGYDPQPGDVAVIQPTSDPKHPEGHTVIYTNDGWVSDYQQWDFWPNSRYRTEHPSYSIYRHPDLAN